MQAPFDNIVQHLFHQPSLHSVTVDELENMAVQHPYFAAAHFLLLKKMQDTAHPSFNSQLHKTTLYFNNPLWLQFLLQPETVADFSISENPPFINNEGALNAPAAVEAHDNNYQQPEDFAVAKEESTAPVEETAHEYQQVNTTEESPDHHSDQNTTHTGAASTMDIITEVFSEPADIYQQPAHEEIQAPVEETTTPQHADEPVYADNNNWIPATENTPAEEIPAAAAIEEPQQQTEDITVTTAEHEAHWAEPLPAPVPEETNESAVEENPVEQTNEIIQPDNHTNEPAAEEPVLPPADYTQADQPIVVEETSVMQEETAPVHTNLTGQEEEKNIATEEQVGRTEELNQSSTTHSAEQPAENEHETGAAQHHMDTGAAREEIRFIKPLIIETPAAKDDLLFEPYHTVDYFASQGIKLSKIEADSKDKLGKQLKSFTEWLKTMKKLPQASIEKMLSQNEESKVVEDANHSIENKEVITEAMAEVFEKQGLNDKAVGVYQKLSLLNPSKSAYFAAKIDLLKQ